jgi:hypothetical protein
MAANAEWVRVLEFFRWLPSENTRDGGNNLILTVERMDVLWA